jgi:tripartite-type tricarboxylate transporter receptor subunit TctC
MPKSRHGDRLAIVVAGAVALAAQWSTEANGETAAEFYKGKTISIYVGVSAGGIYSTFATLLARHMGQHMPGHPNAIVQHMPGAGGSIAVNHVYTVAPKDGTALITPNAGIHLRVPLGIDKPTYDVAKFQWVGGWGESVNTLTLRKDIATAKSVEEAKSSEVILGAIGRGSNTYLIPALMNGLIGTKFKLITGYRGGSPIRLAIEKGEVQGWAGQWEGWKLAKPDWVRDGKIVHLVQLATKSHPDLRSVPLLVSFAQDDEQRRIFEVVQSGIADRALAAPPGVPKDRVAAVEAAYHKTLSDPKFMAEAKAAQFDIDPITAEQVNGYIEKIARLPQPTIARMKTAMGLK